MSEIYLQAEVLFKSGKYAKCAELLRQVCKDNPQDATAWNRLGNTYLHMKNYPEASNCYRKVLQLEPDLVAARFFLGIVEGEMGNMQDAIQCFEQVIQKVPDHIGARLKIGLAYQILGYPRKTIAEYQYILARDPEHIEGNIRMGDLYLLLGEPAKAEKYFGKALSVNPEVVDAVASLAAIMVRGNRLQEAYDLIKPYIDGEIDNIRIAMVFSDLCDRFDHCDRAIASLEHLLETALAHAHGQQIRVLFALGNLLDKQQDYERAFHYYRRGNDLVRNDYDAEGIIQKVESFISVCSRAICSNESAQNDQMGYNRPLFIVGMPRSGTTLVEQILSSHTKVHGAGELQDIGEMASGLPAMLGSVQPYPACLAQLDRETLGRLSRIYRNKIKEIAGEGNAYVTDKMPDNFWHLGLIQRLFPDARIIHVMRNPMDNCLSCYFQDFAGIHPYAYRLETLGHYYRAYERLMWHWRNVIRMPMLEVQYENLISDQEREVRRLVDFCDLQWEEQCLKFYDAGRVVVTASYGQVSKPIYSKSIDRWKHYETFLQPLKDSLQLRNRH